MSALVEMRRKLLKVRELCFFSWPAIVDSYSEYGRDDVVMSEKVKRIRVCEAPLALHELRQLPNTAVTDSRESDCYFQMAGHL